MTIIRVAFAAVLGRWRFRIRWCISVRQDRASRGVA